MLRRDPRTESYKQLLSLAEDVVQAEHANDWEQVCCRPEEKCRATFKSKLAFESVPLMICRTAHRRCIAMQQRRARVSVMCLEASSIREGRGIAQAAARMQNVSAEKKRITEQLCQPVSELCKRASGTEQNKRCRGHSQSLHNDGSGQHSEQPCRTAPSSHKRPLKTRSPPPVREKRPALAQIQNVSSGDANPACIAAALSDCPAAIWPGIVEGSRSAPQCLVIKHVDAATEIPLAWLQAVSESEVKAKLDENAENRATYLARKMERLGKEACARVANARHLKEFDKDLAAHEAITNAERVEKLNRGRRKRLQQASMRGGGTNRGCKEGSGHLTHRVNEHVRRSVYCREVEGARPGSGDQGRHEEQPQGIGCCRRYPLEELEVGFFGAP
jgi:hypothetical protein